MNLERSRRDIVAPAILAVVSAATIAAAWAFELIGGYVPCALCLQERIPYYIGVPVALVALVAAIIGSPVWLKRLLLLAVAAIFACGAWLGIYHAGAEWGFWPGPADCGAGGGQAATSAEDLLSQIEGMRIVSCSEASWRFPDGWGLSFAGWNAAASLFLVLVALWGAKRAPRSDDERYGSSSVSQ
jgi:disulfide bond formation protein DsbB